MKTKWFFIYAIICMIPVTVAAQKNADPSGSKRKKVIVTGFVTDSTSQPIQGAALFVDGKQTNTYTDNLGFYSLKVKRNIRTILAFSLMHGGHEVNYTGQETINFKLSSSPAEEPVLQYKKTDDALMTPAHAAENDETSSISTIDGRKIENHNYRTIYDMIKGEIPGVYVAGSSIIIRGPSSVNASSEALLVVDGAIVPTISDINPGDVQSITALKGSAAAIYGNRGANGVIVIKLKGSR